MHLAAQTIEHSIIVSDGGSTDGTPENIGSLFPYVTLVTHAEDPGYAAAANAGVAAGRGELILLLNNDAFCRPDFLEHLVASFDDECVGAVAPLTIQADERTIDSVRAETFTAIERSCPAARSRPSVVSACSSARRDIEPISPVFSASGMKMSGEIIP